jgi:hypothetical protein
VRWITGIGKAARMSDRIVNDKGRYVQEFDTAHLPGSLYDHETPEVAKRSHFQCSPKTSPNLLVVLRT